MFHCPEEDRNLNGLVTLLSLAQASEEDESFVSPYELLMREINYFRHTHHSAPTLLTM